MLGWTTEIWRLILISVPLLLVGLLTGYLGTVLWIGVLAYLAWNLYHIAKLERWMREGKKFQPPNASGIWGQIYQHFYRLQQRHRKRKKRLTNFLKRFQKSTAAMPDAVVILRSNSEIDWWNEAARTLLDLRFPQDAGQRIGNLVRDPRFVDYLLRGDFTRPVEFISPVDDQTHLQGRVVAFGKNERLLLIQDITQLYRVEQMRKDFVANVSHELRTPLTVVKGFIETLQDNQTLPGPQLAHSLELMAQQSERMQNLVEDLLLLSRLESATLDAGWQDVAVPDLIESLIEEARSFSGAKDHQFRLEVDAQLWLRGIQEELYSAFSNLVFNAVRYTPAGGDICVAWYCDDAGVHFSVEDSGIGIDKHHLSRLTERFYRVDVGRSREYGGTGLGLAICKHVLQRHQGKLQVESTLGVGSLFRCDFPTSVAIHRATLSSIA